MVRFATLAVGLIGLAPAFDIAAQDDEAPVLTGLKAEAVDLVDGQRKLVQEIVDSLFSFSELGFQEFETRRYLTEMLEANGFVIDNEVSGIPSAWWATWGEGDPVIALGSDVDGIPRSSQLPGAIYRKPIIDGAPGHGEGHNSGQAVVIAAALAVKSIMEREGIGGTLVIWPGVAEELLATKAWFTRDGRFEDVDAVIFTHVDDSMAVNWGQPRGTGLVSVEYTFEGVAAHGAGDPWRGRSALDAVEIMNVAWNFRREHLRPLQRSHYVIVDGGDQPNVVPPTATVWYFVREMTGERIRENFDALQRTAEGATLMTDTRVSRRIVGTAYPRHFNRPIAEAMFENIRAVGMPDWSEDDQAFARAFQGVHGGRRNHRTQDRDRRTRRTIGDPAVGWFRRYRRHLLGRAHGDAAFPVQYRWPTGPPLVQRHRHGHSGGAQGRGRRSKGGCGDAAGPAAGSFPGRIGVGVLQGGTDRDRKLRTVH